MNLPLFTAERSLYQTKTVYHEFDYYVDGPDQLGSAYLAGGTSPNNPCEGVHCAIGKKCIVIPAEINNGISTTACVDNPTTVTCKTGQSSCLGPYGWYCVNSQSDPNNCGGCGYICDGNQKCVNGQCICSDPSFTDCGIINGIDVGCAGLKFDPDNCGKCGNQCKENECCNNGKCTSIDTDIDNCGSCGNVCHSGDTCYNGCCLTSTVNLKSGGGQGNYFMYSGNCNKPIGDLTVQVEVTETFITPNGFSFQLNAVPSPQSGTHPVTWMQYTIAVIGNQLTGNVEYWNAINGQTSAANLGNWNNCILFSNQNVQDTCPASQSCSCDAWDYIGDFFSGDTCCSVQFGSVPTPDTLPANYTLEIELVTDSQKNVKQANFSVNNGSAYSIAIPQQYRAPVQSFQFLAVGANNSAVTTFSSGKANVTYSSDDSDICVLGGGDTCTGGGVYNGGTGETSNATYTATNTCCGQTLNQTINT